MMAVIVIFAVSVLRSRFPHCWWFLQSFAFNGNGLTNTLFCGMITRMSVKPGQYVKQGVRTRFVTS